MSSSESGQCSHGQQQQEEENARMQEQLSRIGHKLLVMSGKGGVGKSSVAAYLALSLAKSGRQVGLLDVDLHGPSIPRMLGLDGVFGFTPDKRMIPHAYNERLHVMSIDCLLEDRDSAVIWRGPVKHGVIKQFITDVAWGDLDFLVIDSPPGTGDEPLSVIQTIPDAKAIIVTTPQEIALADVRKSINFCKQVHMPILGLVENMSGFVCPHCNTETPLLGRGGGARTALQMDIHFLGSMPFDPRMVEAADQGKPLLENPDGSPLLSALERVATEVLDRCGKSVQPFKMCPSGGCGR
ncbi:MAG: Mrp/NBP35 family ATP-binding protein [Deltaproteobacteria bacterium]|nr:Mrp/NBP35 family ATP-binding protein [Deltaproteobacteria bacterium]MDA8305473.1 Mrp/NBP35 family ATP-binding protein [Deltaproteobacteria bacterium]